MPNSHHVERWEGNSCVLGSCTLASTDVVWQSDVNYMCKYSTTSIVDHFIKIEHALALTADDLQDSGETLEEESRSIFYGKP